MDNYTKHILIRGLVGQGIILIALLVFWLITR